MGDCLLSHHQLDVFDFQFFFISITNLASSMEISDTFEKWLGAGWKSKSIQHNLDRALTPNSSNLALLDIVPAASLLDMKGSGSS